MLKSISANPNQICYEERGSQLTFDALRDTMLQ
jgi:hypothetical protein